MNNAEKSTLLTVTAFADGLGVTRLTARKIALQYPEYLVRRGTDAGYFYVKRGLLDKLTSSEVKR